MNSLENISPSLSSTNTSINEAMRLRALINSACEWTWQSDEQLRINVLSRAALTSSGVIAGDLLMKPWWGSSHTLPAFNGSWQPLMTAMEQRLTFRDFAVCYISHLGEMLCLSLCGVPIFDEQGGFHGYWGTVVDITKQQREPTGIARLYHEDPLTGFPNRQSMEKRFLQGLAMAQRKGKWVGYLHLRFPQMRAQQPHTPIAQTLKTLQTVCERISENIRRGDLIGRISMNEFGVVLQEIAQRIDLEKIAEKIQVSLSQPLLLQQQTLSLSYEVVSLMAPDDGEQFDSLIEGSREAMDAPSS